MDAKDRLVDISHKIEEVSCAFRVSKINLGIDGYKILSDDFQDVISLFLELGLEITPFVNMIKEMNVSLEDFDYMAISDCLTYEINPIIKELVNFYEENKYE